MKAREGERERKRKRGKRGGDRKGEEGKGRGETVLLERKQEFF